MSHSRHSGMNMDTGYTLRSRALQRLAALSVSARPTTSSANADFVKLCEACPAPQKAASGYANGTQLTSSSTARVPMSLRELEILIALCGTAGSIHSVFNANRLLQQISPYVTESCSQALVPSPFLRHLSPSPWHNLSYTLVKAVLDIGEQHPSLRERVIATLAAYLHNCNQHASVATSTTQAQKTGAHTAHQDVISLIVLGTSVLGFLEAAAKNPGIWSTQEQRELLHAAQGLLSEQFMVATESALSTVRTSKDLSPEMKEWKHYLKRYAMEGRPLGAMLLRQEFMRLLSGFASLLVIAPKPLQQQDALTILVHGPKITHLRNQNMLSELMLESIANAASQEIVSLEDGSDYLQLESAWQQRMAHDVKARALLSYLCCSLANEDVADPEVLGTWLEACLADSDQIADHNLTSTVLKCMAVLAKGAASEASSISKVISRFLVRNPMSVETATVAAECLVSVLQLLPQDTVITTLYGLGNSLSSRNRTETIADYALFNDKPMNGSNGSANGNGNGNGHTLSEEYWAQNSLLDLNEETEMPTVYNTVILAIVRIAQGISDDKITALALAMLIQKVGKVNATVDLRIVTQAAVLIVHGGLQEFPALLRLYMKLANGALAQHDEAMLGAVREAWDILSTSLKGGTRQYSIYVQHLLETIVSKGDTPHADGGNKQREENFEGPAREMAILLRPLSVLISSNIDTPGIEDVDSYPWLQRDAWYNIVVHGFSTKSAIGQRHMNELMILARYSTALVSEGWADRLESDVDLNTVLRRGKNTDNAGRHKRELIELLPECEADINNLNYQEFMFLKAAHLVETLRAAGGDCTQILTYFVDTQLRFNALGRCLAAIAKQAVDVYLAKTLTGRHERFSAPFAAEQLARVFEGCCHRVATVQQVSYTCAERIIAQVPPAMCHRLSIFALLDLLTVLWTSCLESETDEYEWHSEYSSPSGHTKLQLSDVYEFRRYTLKTFHDRAKEWIRKAVNIAPLDVKGLFQTYLSEYSDDEAFGHMSLGRSFAFEMGAMIPVTDQRLGAIEHEDGLNVNTASDFMAQYTSRQEYRFTDPMASIKLSTMTKRLELKDQRSSSDDGKTGPSDKTIRTALAEVERRLTRHEAVPMDDLRSILRRAASVLCRASGDESSVVAHFVRIPYAKFTKQTVKLGLSLWMGVIKENPRMEPRILVEIVEGWISTVRNRLGIFNSRMNHLDPFYVKEEFAPSDKDLITRQQQRAHDMIAPHFRILQFLSSHYTATRLSSTSVEKAYHRYLKITLPSLRHTTSHPLAREVHFHVILLGLRVLRHSTSLSDEAKWRLKDDLLSAGLAWFSHKPRWSFGGNRLQVKAETHLLADVALLLDHSSEVGLRPLGNLKSLKPKQDLLSLLLGNEQTRLMVWLFPLDHSKRHHFTHGPPARGINEEAVQGVAHTAWSENPAIAIHLASRIQKNPFLMNEIRWLLLNNPQAAIHEPAALSILLGSSLPADVTSHLRYLLYWAPVDPITAVAYFLPAYGNHALIMQYAVRALESHSVDVTFFYVPQIVQTLRYDLLGYVERYIIETAKFSQLFAHQIIWNMNANAYKDEDSQVADPVKPTLDKVTAALISSFSEGDRGFYEREFAFFAEITGISGKLRPFIKKSKPEKKQKIEEELRKITVDVGVYLPSNPDGVVVGIDRKSGKPLQSHAKAPYMATFRIRKERAVDDEEDGEGQGQNQGERGALEVVDEQLGKINESSKPSDADSPAGHAVGHNNANGAAADVARRPLLLGRSETTATAASAVSSRVYGETAGVPVATARSYEVWQSAIFKVGDDCRQDVLALQLISCFRSIFQSVGLPVYVFPYRVTATAPGCGVIDVLPNSISRDMLGREAVNGLYDWFLSKFGGEDSPAFQQARVEFVKSLAAYSVISWLLQFKDRHNGNIMFDDAGHVLHIDFGFCFDIAPGGVKFERAPFKLTKEMIAVMGGSHETQSFRWFEELCVKAFLASRPYVDSLSAMVVTMMDSGLPCFKPETVANFRERFAMEKSERDAADFMRGLVKTSYAAFSTKGYDWFQLKTNGIPY